MKPTNFIAGVFEDPELIFRAAKKMQLSGVKIYDCYTPFAVHGLDKTMGIERTKLSIAAFIYGCTGLIFAITLQWFTSYLDWQVNIGGKPNTPVLVTFVPVCFECTVLFTALGTIMSFWIKSKMFHGVTPDLFDERQTSDLFILAIDADSNKNHDAINQILRDNGAIDIRTKSFDKHHSLIQ